eukprot:24655_1
MSKTRPLNDIEPLLDESPTKKLEINTNTIEIKSIWLLHPSDHSEFKQLFATIDNSELSKSLQIPHFINKEIAEYGTGQFVQCTNSKCNNKIPILHQDAAMYNDNHENANKLGYKWCEQSDEYYCDKCMNSAKSCDCCCAHLHFQPDCDKCNECKTYLCNCECDCDCSCQDKCDNCGIKSCNDCWFIKECARCNKDFCQNCSIMPDKSDCCICNDCLYDENN